MMRSAVSAASWADSTPSSRTANSSPPKRAAVSLARMLVPRRLPTSSRTRSPAAWPRLSLIVLKSSRSMKMTARPMWSRRARATAWRTRSANSARFARPVTGSWKAWCCELLLEGLALADVAAVEDDAADVLVVEQVRVLDLEVQRVAVAVAQRAVEDGGAGGAVVGGRVVEEVQEAALLALREQAREARADDLVGRVAEDALDGRALVDDPCVGVEHGDEVARRADERAEARLARAAVDLLGQRGALERERDLGGERAQAVLRGAGAGVLAAHDEQAAGLGADRQAENDGLLVVAADVQVGATPGRERQERAAVVRGGAEQRPGGRGRQCPALHVGRGGGARRDDLERVVLDEAQQRLGVRADERLDRVEGGEGDLVAARRGDERAAGGGERALAGDGALLLAHEAGHAGDDQAEQHGRRADDHDQVHVALVDHVHGLDGRGDQGRAGEQRETEGRELRDAVDGRALEAAHRRVQRRGAPEQVEADPADVEDDLAVVGALERDDAVGEVGDEQRDDAQREKVEGGLAAAAVDGQADRGGEQQDVAERVGDRDELRDGAHRAVVQVRRDQRDPREEREAERHDQRVDDARAVALRVAPAHEHQQARHERRVDEHVRAVAQRRERHVGAEQPRVAVRVEVAEPEEQEPDGEEPPRAGRLRAVHPQAGDDRDDRRQPEQVHHRAA